LIYRLKSSIITLIEGRFVEKSKTKSVKEMSQDEAKALHEHIKRTIKWNIPIKHPRPSDQTDQG
jgi:hypothetical protein